MIKTVATLTVAGVLIAHQVQHPADMPHVHNEPRFPAELEGQASRVVLVSSTSSELMGKLPFGSVAFYSGKTDSES